MKRIIKQQEPRAFIKFKQENERGGVKLRYDINLGTEQREPIKEALLKEQGYICAYTLKRISLETSHIEHLKPEELCRQDMQKGIKTVSDLDYINMVACFPIEAPKGIAKDKFFGAIKKDDHWVNNGADYILPLQANCEDHFKYNKLGEVQGKTAKGCITVALLALDHPILNEERKKAIESFIGKSTPLKKVKTLQALSEIDKLENDKYIEFCIPLKHALQEHLIYLEKIERKLKYAKKQ